MDWETREQKEIKGVFKGSLMLKQSFYIFTLTLLSLLLPLSFLLLARLSRIEHFLTILPSAPKPVSYLLSIFLYTNPTLLHLLISFVSVTTLVHVLTGRVPVLIDASTSSIIHPRLYTGWVMLCALQVCVGLGIEGTIAAGIWTRDYNGGTEASMSLSRIVFFIGLHETMAHWSRVFVRPVIDDTIFGGPREEQWPERAVIGASYGLLWWWRLRDEAEGLIVLVDVKGELAIGLGIADVVNWWLYYLTVTIAVVRVGKGLAWAGKALCSHTRRKECNCSSFSENDERV